ncbi:Alkaline phosphatase [Denitrovibrio acetiphilus DSM 12809]|uniref:Alkaline phosphatase n=1 Tax=Denitrovibrio acetiphilus (strain DSM 12809 / NBRC 114555 / N2460) TaxID=522772 RepID=D4H631_DENA2|nr:alkaline phosphatase [Denitrovibrio acetiphilus]ADD67677.1 Alkaline phosphatase [Denitrovibrio acetiphilus DSM 12809]
MRNFTMKIFMTALLVAVFAVSSFAQVPKYVFYFIGDGLGSSQRQVAEYYMQQKTGNKAYKLHMDKMPAVGINTTYSADTLVTDSAAAGTALATGYKTNNGMISMLPDGTKVDSLMEIAESKGWVTGIVTTTRLTHATPAVFASHNISRDNENEIAAEMTQSGAEYIAGGGYRHFVPKDGSLKSKRKDDKDLVKELAQMGYKTFVGEKNEPSYFRNYVPAKGDKVFAAFSYSHAPYEVDRIYKDMSSTPSIAEMTEKGIQVLAGHDKPFFMMVEGGRIDHACHANDVLGSIMDTVAFDKAIGEALAFYNQHPDETLIVVVGDHETGGLGLGFAKNYFLKIEKLDKVRRSIDDSMAKAYTGDKESFVKFVEQYYGLADMTTDERVKLLLAMEAQDKGANEASSYGGYTPTQIAVAHILSERANIQWTTFAHTGTQIPMSAVGVGAEQFVGFKDNTEIAQTLASLLNFRLADVKVASK